MCVVYKGVLLCIAMHLFSHTPCPISTHHHHTLPPIPRNFVPSVIEPSFGIGRIIYCMFEHCFYTRQDARTVFKFTPVVAPVKATVFPLLQRAELNEVATRVASSLTAAGLATVIDTTGTTIGKRYARTDEIGVPFAVTVDYDTLKDDTVTVRDRDSMAQVWWLRWWLRWWGSISLNCPCMIRR